MDGEQGGVMGVGEIGRAAQRGQATPAAAHPRDDPPDPRHDQTPGAGESGPGRSRPR